MMIQDFLTGAAQRNPDAILLIQGGLRATYGEVERRSNQLAHLLIDLGTRRGDRVALLHANSPHYVTAYYAILKSGAIAVPLHAASDARTIQRLLGDCEAVGLVSGAHAVESVAGAAGQLPNLRFVVFPDSAEFSVEFPGHVHLVRESRSTGFESRVPSHRVGIDLDRAAIIYTSGSTGRPRGAVLSHLNIVANTQSILQYLHLTHEDRVLVVMPFSYVYGKSLLNTHVAVGGSLVLHDNLVFPETLLDVAEREAVTGFSGVPPTFAMLLNRSSLGKRKIPSLRYVTQAGGSMPVAHTRRLIEALPGVKIYVMYGATEASARLSYLEPEMLQHKLGSIGRAIPNVELTIRRDDGSEAGLDEVGEIVARGSNIMEGYWGDPEATKEVLSEHGFHTGDLGRRDKDGYFWHAGRKREMIKSGGHRVSPREIEDTLLEHLHVDEVAVVGIPDEFMGEVITAHVTLRPGAQAAPELLKAFCAERLPAYKVPQAVVVRDSMPRNPSGKIDKRILRGETDR